MHEIPNFPFPSLHEPEQTQASQTASQQQDGKKQGDTEKSKADRKDQSL